MKLSERTTVSKLVYMDDRALQLSIKSELDKFHANRNNKLLSINKKSEIISNHIFQFPFLICKYKKGRLWGAKASVNIPYLSQSESAIRLSKKGSS